MQDHVYLCMSLVLKDKTGKRNLSLKFEENLLELFFLLNSPFVKKKNYRCTYY